MLLKPPIGKDFNRFWLTPLAINDKSIKERIDSHKDKALYSKLRYIEGNCTKKIKNVTNKISNSILSLADKNGLLISNMKDKSNM